MSVPETTDLELQRSSILVELGRFDEAIVRLAQLVASDPQNAEAWCLISQSHLGLDEPVPALQAAGIAASLVPTLEWPHRLASIALERDGRLTESLAAAREAVRWAPLEWQTYIRLAYAAIRNAQVAESRHAIQQAQLLGATVAAVHVAAGEVAKATGDSSEALKAFRRALEIDPQNVQAHNAIGILHFGNGRYKGSRKLALAADGFAGAVRADPGRSTSRRNLHLVLRAFLVRLTYILFLDVYLAGYGLHEWRAPVARAIPLLLLALPALFGYRFLRRLSPPLRKHVSESVWGHELRVPVYLDGLAILLIMAAAVAPQTIRTDLAGGAACAAVVCRLWLYMESRFGWR